MRPTDSAIDSTATGLLVRYVPAGPKRDELLALVRIGTTFWRQWHIGKRPGCLAQLVFDCTRRAGPPYSFAQLLDQLELAAARRALHGEQASPVEKIDRIWQLATVHLPKRGRVQVPFKTLQNHLTDSKKKLRAAIPDAR
jgi:hypothetical protein